MSRPLQVENNSKLNVTSHCGFINTDKIKQSEGENERERERKKFKINLILVETVH